MLDITHRLDYPQLAADAAAAFESLQPAEREVRSIDGRWYLARILPYRTGEHRIDGAVLTFIDFTTLHHAEERARHNEQRALDGAAAMMTLDARGHVVHWSLAAQALFGRSAAQMAGQPAEMLDAPADRTRGALAAELRRASETGCAEGTRSHQAADGSSLPCRSVTLALLGPGPVAFVRVLRPAGAAGDERDRQLDAARSERASAEASNALKDEFLAVMSHELKQPLNLIGVNAQVLARLPEVRESSLAVRALDNINRSVRGQSKIIEDLLDLSRMRTGKLTLSLAPLDLVALVRSIVEVAQADASTSQLDVCFDTDHEPVLVYADGVRLEQVVWNLLGNAIKFTPAGGRITLKVTTHGEEARLEVRDSGQGIAREFLPHIFEMFDQGDGVGQRNRGGLGIGLALVRQLMELHGGRVAADSAGSGQGATLTIWVPLYVSSVGTPSPPQKAGQARALEGIQLLLVDDNAETVESLAFLLELEGARVLRATDAAAALELAREHAAAIDVLLSDIGMPGMDGYQLVAALRALPEFGDKPAVALTGFGRTEGGERALRAGFSAKLTKPVGLEALVSTIHSLRGT